ncbi:hypothetical protein BDV11DRAFT_186934 [Aspergillus similis]
MRGHKMKRVERRVLGLWKRAPSSWRLQLFSHLDGLIHDAWMSVGFLDLVDGISKGKTTARICVSGTVGALGPIDFGYSSKIVAFTLVV